MTDATPTRRLFIAGLLTTGAGLGLALRAPGALAAGSSEQQALVDKARFTVQAFTADPDMGAFRYYLRRAIAVLIFPDIFKAGFFIGGEGGSGVLLGRNAGTDTWTPPAFYTMGGGSLGLQFGAEQAQVILLVMNTKALDAVINNQVKLGADASIAVGPIGKGVAAATTTAMNQDILSFSRSKGLFAGVSVAGSVLKARNDWDQLYYGRAVTAGDVVLRHMADAPGADALRQAVSQAGQKRFQDVTGTRK